MRERKNFGINVDLECPGHFMKSERIQLLVLMVKSVSHILGLRAFGSPLLTEQIIGRGLRRTNYDILNQALEGRTNVQS